MAERDRVLWAQLNVTLKCEACGRVVPGDGDMDHTTIISAVFGEWPPRYVILDRCEVEANRQRYGTN